MADIRTTLVNRAEYRVTFSPDEVVSILTELALAKINKEAVQGVDAVVLLSDKPAVKVKVYRESNGGFTVDVEHDRTAKPRPEKTVAERLEEARR